MADEHALADHDSRSIDDAAALELHERLLDGHPLAQERLAEAFLGRVTRVLARSFPTVQSQCPDWIVDAAIDGIMVYLDDPARFEPRRSRLLSYLVGIAKNKLRSRRQEEMSAISGHSGREKRIFLVSIDRDEGGGESVGNTLADQNTDIERQVMALLEDAQFVRWLRPRLNNKEDWAVTQLLMDRATSTKEYAAAVHLDPATISAEDLARLAYDHKERVKKRLRRLRVAYKEGRELRSYKRRRGDAEPKI